MTDKAAIGPSSIVIPSAGDGWPLGTADHPLRVALDGKQRRQVGPFYGTTAATQTGTTLTLGAAAGMAFVAPRAGKFTGVSAQLDAAITGAGTNIVVKVFKSTDHGATWTEVNAALRLTFTQAGGEKDLYVTVDPTLYSFNAGDLLRLEYDSTGISNTPKVTGFLEVEC